jgi:hypothetical protein
VSLKELNNWPGTNYNRKRVRKKTLKIDEGVCILYRVVQIVQRATLHLHTLFYYSSTCISRKNKITFKNF